MVDYSNETMDYNTGVEFMKSISKKGSEEKKFQFGKFTISYPGYKRDGDYRLSYSDTGSAPKHTDVIDMIESLCTTDNRELIVEDLEKIYNSGLNADTLLIDTHLKTKIFWITLQEEINYPRPKFKGILLPFQRFFEATLLCLNLVTKEQLYSRTNNHGGGIPKLLFLENLNIPAFYIT